MHTYSIGPAGIKELARVLDTDTRMKQLYLRGNPMDEASQAELESSVSHHPSLVLFI
jgi:hypothetical protein